MSGVALMAAHDSARVLWAVTALLALGVCAIYSNVVSLLSAYDLLTPVSVSMLQVACGVGHMTVPFGVSVVMRHTSLGYDALFHVLVVTNSVCLAALVAVVLHLLLVLLLRLLLLLSLAFAALALAVSALGLDFGGSLHATTTRTHSLSFSLSVSLC